MLPERDWFGLGRLLRSRTTDCRVAESQIVSQIHLKQRSLTSNKTMEALKMHLHCACMCAQPIYQQSMNGFCSNFKQTQ